MQTLSFFSADFRNDRIYIAGKSYPTGSFALRLLQEAEIKEAVARVCVFYTAGEKVLSFLDAGSLYEKDLLVAGAEIAELQKALARLSPFRFLKLQEEQERTQKLFTAETARVINEYFRQWAELVTHNPDELYVRHDYNLSGDPAKHPGRALMNEVTATLRFYASLSDSFYKAYDGLRRFERRLDEVERFDEGHLFALAQQVFPRADFDVHTEYVPYQAKEGGKTIIARRLSFESYYSFFLTDFYEGLRCGHYPRRCPSCGKYFLMQSARRQIYCSGMAPLSKTGGKKLTCRQWALRRESGLAKEKAPGDPVKELYRNRCSVIRMYERRGEFDTELAEAAKRAAREHLAEAIRDPEYAAADYRKDMQHQSIVTEAKRMLNH